MVAYIGGQPAFDEADTAASGTARCLLKKRHIVVLARGPRGSLKDGPAEPPDHA